MIIEWDADCVDDYGGIPEPGDFIEYNGHEMLVVRSHVENKSKVIMKVSQKTEIEHYSDPSELSTTWKEIDSKYLNNVGDTDFLNSGLTPNE